MLLNETSTSRTSTTFLDGCRGLAALFILIHHARYLLHEGYTTGFKLHPQDYSLFSKAIFYSLAAFRNGHTMVLFFFVLSGFVIHLRYAKQLQRGENKFELGSYLWRRARRLYPPLLMALALTYVLDRVGSAQGWLIYTGHCFYPEVNKTLHLHHDLKTLFGNLAFLMDVKGTTYVNIWGSDGPLWSLRYEWWFYMLYPLFWWLTRAGKTLAAGVMTTLFVLSFLPGIWVSMLLRETFQMMIIWWMGVLLADVYTKRINIKWKYLLPLLICPALMVFHVSDEIGSVLWGLGFSGLIAAGFAAQELGIQLRLLERLKFLGDMSYSLYVMHMPMLVFMSGWLMSRRSDGHLPAGFGPLALGCSIALGLTYLAHLVVERPFVRSQKAKAQAPVVVAT